MAEKWSLSGTFFESCNCEAYCPCQFLSPPTEEECTSLFAWHIESGRYGEIGLDGLNVAMAFHSPGHVMENKWTLALYLDDRADPAQAEALTQIYGGQAGGFFEALGDMVGEVLPTRTVPIEFQANGRQLGLRLGDLAEMTIEAVPGQEEAEVTIANPPLTLTPGHEAVVARSERLRFQDHGRSWELSNRHALYAPFTYAGG